MGERNTDSVVGAGVGAAAGTVVLFVAEAAAKQDFPVAVDGAVIVLVTFLVSLLVPPSRGA